MSAASGRRSEDVTLPEGAVVAVIVTRHRRELLTDSLKVIAAQTRQVDHLIVVDNGPDQSAADVVADCPIPTTYLLSQRNLGGAGGFALGMLHALSLGAEWIWLGDDDGRPADENALEILLDEAERRRLAVVSPVVVNIDHPELLAFPMRRGLTWKRQRDELGEDFLPGIASFFNGALFRASTLDVVGVPDYRMFFRGDEVEIHRRVARSGLRFGTSLRTTFVHPDGSAEFKPMLGGRLHAQDPEDPIKRYYTYRNRGYLLSKPGMRKLGLLEVFRFGLYFLGVRRDPKAFVKWLRLVRQGQQERFFRA
ncbi:glycosyltransferase [Actinoalloteichus spitiensis]|uniref:galactofuranosyltransferase GlfT1 n=1 Tax=Actinoalloteichus spitiensis TaxID=252394 RepID=UPI00035E6AE7|nr:glycosyltransferase family 2 protein [Actinoalloteichus spitiensis]